MDFETLQGRVDALGLGRVGVVDLKDSRLEAGRRAYEGFLARGFAGEMGYLERNQDLRKYPEQLLEGAQSALVFATAYRGRAGKVARCAQGQDYHRVLRARIEGLREELCGAYPDARFLSAVDTKPVLERSLAQVAGLGFIGKHGCIIVPGVGSYVFLSVLLSTLAVDTWKKSEDVVVGPPKSLQNSLNATGSKPWDRCAQCRACLDACPTQAFPEPGVLDARRCISYLTIEYRGEIPEDLAMGVGERIAGCDRCQEVCPYNASPKREERENPRQWLPAPQDAVKQEFWNDSILDIANKGSNQYKRWVKGTAFDRIPKTAMLRNLCVYLGNRKDLNDGEREFLKQAQNHKHESVAAAARWAVGQHASA